MVICREAHFIYHGWYSWTGGPYVYIRQQNSTVLCLYVGRSIMNLTFFAGKSSLEIANCSNFNAFSCVLEFFKKQVKSVVVSKICKVTHHFPWKSLTQGTCTYCVRLDY